MNALIRYSMKTEKYCLRNLRREADCIVLVNSMKDETTNEIQVKIRHALKILEAKYPLSYCSVHQKLSTTNKIASVLHVAAKGNKQYCRV